MLSAEERDLFWNLRVDRDAAWFTKGDVMPHGLQQAVENLLKTLEEMYPQRPVRMLILSTLAKHCEETAVEMAKGIMHESSPWTEGDGDTLGDITLEGIAYCVGRNVKTVKKWNTEIVRDSYWAYQESKSAATEAAAREAHGYGEG